MVNELYKALRMVYSWYTKKQKIYYYEQGHSTPSMVRLLLEEDIVTSRVGITKLIGRYKQSGTIIRCPSSGRPIVITPEIKTIVEEKIRLDDETTAEQLLVLLTWHEFRISRKTILRCRADLRCTFRDIAYCQLIHESNKAKQLQWARDYKMLSKRLFGPTNVPSNSKLIKDSAAGNKEKHPDQKPDKHHIH